MRSASRCLILAATGSSKDNANTRLFSIRHYPNFRTLPTCILSRGSRPFLRNKESSRICRKYRFIFSSYVYIRRW
ncbi:hypothetical protein D3OALGB2SA_4247 [Olavius algarvensis associated proteobacterium Delta 3]|nr:hypothetical protein D3OALGB2SA_4247 [Olavius algarvensis associated proteobacterium Delta 3]